MDHLLDIKSCQLLNLLLEPGCGINLDLLCDEI